MSLSDDTHPLPRMHELDRWSQTIAVIGHMGGKHRAAERGNYVRAIPNFAYQPKHEAGE